MKKLKQSIIAIILLLVGGGGYYAIESNLGSVATGQAYNATTTPYLGAWTDQLIRRGGGTLGSVVITKSGDLAFIIVDATTTPNSIDNFSTSTKTLAAFPANTAVGTYVFDVTYTDGLVIEVQTGTLGTSTITFR